MELLTVKETAEMLRVSTVTVRRYIASGKLAAVRVGRNIRIRRKDAERVIEPAGQGSYPKFIAEDKAKYFSSANPLSITEGNPETEYEDDPARNLREAFADERQGNVPVRSKLAAKSDERPLEHHSWLNLIGILDEDDGITDSAENHDKYLAEAYGDTHEEDESPIVNPDADTTLTPREWMLKNHPLFWTLPGGAHEGEPEYIERYEALLAKERAKHSGSGKPVDWDSPLWDVVGMIKDDGPTDYSTNLDKYLVEAIMDNHEE